jgi:hypothetical protein
MLNFPASVPSFRALTFRSEAKVSDLERNQASTPPPPDEEPPGSFSLSFLQRADAGPTLPPPVTASAERGAGIGLLVGEATRVAGNAVRGLHTGLRALVGPPSEDLEKQA